MRRGGRGGTKFAAWGSAVKSPPTKFAFVFRFLFFFAQVSRAEKGKRERAQNADAHGNDDI